MSDGLAVIPMLARGDAAMKNATPLASIAKLTPASQRGILHCVDTQAITLAWISH
ncbi:hypothetical protein [Pseudoxanthomonas sp. CF385]|uniref:hypothetical protein n=1 Tax=Pseudoxanthomonas sp. CF385 TaxID=1881042 RepID=UPI001587B62D|nr:hypothetical protein [Pseudoxanthomonas sp. CF385]